VGTIATSPVPIPAGSIGATTSFQPGQAGTATLAAAVPTGFTAPAIFGSVGVTVATAGIAVTDGVSIGKNLQIQGSFTLGAFASPGLVVTLTSSNASLLRISASPNVAGSSSIGITMAGGTFQGTYYLQALSNTGTVQYTASAPGYASRTGTITLTPSGIVLGNGVSPGGTVVGTTIVVSMAQLDSGGTFVEMQQLAAGQSDVSVDLSITTVGATITTPVKITGGSSGANATLSGSGGFGFVTASTPPGYTTSNIQTVQSFF